jgi:hypothetical protein
MRYRDAWWDVVRDATEQDVRTLAVLERCFLDASMREEHALDRDVAMALEELEKALSPIELVAGPPSPLTRTVLAEVEAAIGAKAATRDALRAAVPRLLAIVAALRDPSSPRAFLRGLAAWAAAHPEAAPRSERSGLIVTPDDLRRPE